MNRWPYLALLSAALAVGGCDDMGTQPKDKPFHRAGQQEKGPMQPPDGTVATPEPDTMPPPLTLALIERGRERFDIFCAPCHSRVGDGQGMIVQRGFPAPPSYHIERLRAAPPGYFYDVMTNGFGVMFSYAQRVPPADRWAIAAYIKALQASQDAALADVPPDKREALR